MILHLNLNYIKNGVLRTKSILEIISDNLTDVQVFEIIADHVNKSQVELGELLSIEKFELHRIGLSNPYINFKDALRSEKDMLDGYIANLAMQMYDELPKGIPLGTCQFIALTFFKNLIDG